MKTKWQGLWPTGIVFMLTGAIVVFCDFLSANDISSAQEERQTQQTLSKPGGLRAGRVRAGNITVDFKEADIHDVLKILSYKSGINIVAGQDVSGMVTIRLVNVPWERALEVILKNSGFVYERDADIIRVTTVENLSKEELSTQLFVLNYAQADLVATAIKEILSNRGRVKFDQRTNQLVVTDVPSNLYKVSKVIDQLDQKTVQVLIEARVIETTLDDDEKLGIDWTLSASATGSSRLLTFPFAFGKSYGKTGEEYFPRVDTSVSAFANSAPSGFPMITSTGDFTFGTLSFTQLQSALEILKTRSDTKALSNPRIVTLNNKQAEIHVGDDYNIPLYERNSSTGQMEITGYETEQIGVRLTVTPHVNAQGEITVDLHPEISSFTGLQDFGNVKAPVFSTREAKTQIMVTDGETIVIGGLIKETTVDAVDKIPILGDLPLLKYVFSKTAKTVDTTDLIIFVTVRLLDSDNPGLQKQQAKLSD